MKPRLLLLLCAAAVLAGCASSPPVNYYTLVGPRADSGAAQAAPAGYMIEILPVTVPPQADQPQIMMRNGDGAVTPLYSDRWTAPLSDEIRAALSDALTRDLGALDVQSIQPAAGAPVWRIMVDVQRFDNVAGGPASIDATWRIRPVNAGGSALLCRTVTRANVQGTAVSALVTGQQQALSELAAVIAAAVRAGGAQPQTSASPDGVQLLGCNQSKP
jgi:uncharacterized lipoprotein YmbA